MKHIVIVFNFNVNKLRGFRVASKIFPRGSPVSGAKFPNHSTMMVTTLVLSSTNHFRYPEQHAKGQIFAVGRVCAYENEKRDYKLKFLKK